MTEQTTPTDEVVDQSSSDIRDESLLDDNNEQDSAVERNEDTDSSESQDDSDSDNSSSADDSSDEDKALAKFAKSQGIEDLSDLSERERKLLKVAQDNQKAFRKKNDEGAAQKKVDKEVNDLYKPDENDGNEEVLAKRLALIETRQMTRDFWSENQDDRDYEGKMVELLIEEKNNFGPDAARLLSQNLPRLLREAKAASGAYDSDAARDAGRREERERLKKSQEGGADAAHATTSSSAGKAKITRESLESMPYEEYAKLRDSGELDKIIQRGDLY